MLEWKFPNGQDLTPKGVNNSAIEIFLDNVAESLTREVLQNSLDAHNNEVDGAVKITFDFFNMPTNNIPNIDDIKNIALPKALALWTEKNNKDTLDFLKRFSDVLHAPEVPVLKISDYNTTGLNKKKYESLILGDGYSEKDNIDSSGSKGIGKAAPFAASDLRMVFYNTVATEGTEKSVGVMNFVSFKIKEENFITQERATYVDNEKEYIAEQLTFGFPKRNDDEYGTDLFIIGLKDYGKWTENIILSTLNNFLLSITQGKLNIQVGGLEISKDTVDGLMKKIYEEGKLRGNEKAQFLKTYRFYEVLINPATLQFDLDERFQKYPFVKDVKDAKLYLLQHEPANRTVLQTRAAGMKIYERNYISGNINFSGVFQALGKELNEYLKDLENANHNTWSVDRKQGVAHTQAENLLNDLLHWYKDKVQEAFADIGTDEIDAFGVNDLLPLNEQQTEGSKKSKDSGIKNNFEEFKVTRKNNSIQTLDGDKEDELLKNVLDAVGLGEGETSGSGGKRDGIGGGDAPDTNYGTGDEPGDKGQGGDTEQVFTNKEKRIGPSTAIKLKIIELNAVEGKYRVVGKVMKKSKAIEIELKSIGANGITYPLKVVDAESSSNNITIKRNAVRLENLSKNSVFNTDIKVDSKLRLKMEGTVYEIKG